MNVKPVVVSTDFRPEVACNGTVISFVSGEWGRNKIEYKKKFRHIGVDTLIQGLAVIHLCRNSTDISCRFGKVSECVRE